MDDRLAQHLDALRRRVDTGTVTMQPSAILSGAIERTVRERPAPLTQAEYAHIGIQAADSSGLLSTGSIAEETR